jgi:GNAT superfamily N-acetyltransferase
VSREDSDILIREAGDDDIDEIIAVCGAALGWDRAKPNADLFRWKHLDNPFGRSRIWVAEDDGRIVGVRPLMRWRFARGDERFEAVRAVDTATLPEAQGKGIFSKLTRHAVEVLTDEGMDFVFNTPNDKSRPGYLQLGWVEAGRPRVATRLSGFRAATKVARARQAAEKWSTPTDVGLPVDQLTPHLSDAPADQLSTDRSPEYLKWRYGFGPLNYRAFVAPDGTGIFRLRRRGPAVECTVCELLAEDGRQTLKTLAGAVDADYLLVATGDWQADRLIPLPGQGPIVTTRDLATSGPASVEAFDFSLGDLELF